MGAIQHLIDLFLHLDEHLTSLTNQYGGWTYAILFLVIFCETGLVVTPFLPGDSLLFAAGALAALGTMNPVALFFLLAAAAILGDTVNYWIGHAFGARLVRSRWLKAEHLERTHRFYERHGGKTIIMARFVPIIRTFAPFVAGVGKMSYRHFVVYNIAGGILWVALFVLAGYFFGNIPAVRNNFSWVILAIIAVSLLPAVVEFLRHRRQPASGNDRAAQSEP